MGKDGIKGIVSNRKKPRKDIFIPDDMKQNQDYEVPTLLLEIILNRMLRNELGKHQSYDI
jgi:hypothetical protein